MNVNDDQLSNSLPNSHLSVDSVKRTVKSLSEYDFGSLESSDTVVQLNGHSSPSGNEYSFVFANSPSESTNDIANRSPAQLPNMLPNYNNAIIAPQDLVHKPKVITLSLTCLVPACGVACEDKFLFEDHMLDMHGIEKYRCVFHDCARSFASTLELCDHVREEHANVTDWLCGSCGKVYKTNGSLSKHLNDCHQAGHFVCSVAGCTFESHINRKQVYFHLCEHFQFECGQCGKTFETRRHLTTHLQVSGRSHNDEKLKYRCTWPGCQFKGSHRNIVTGHVRIKHFKLPRFKNQQAQLGIFDARNARQFARKIRQQR